MNEALTQEIKFLSDELSFLQAKISAARNEGNTAEYSKLMRICLTVQKQYLKLCAELEKLTETEVDELAAFNGA